MGQYAQEQTMQQSKQPKLSNVQNPNFKRIKLWCMSIFLMAITSIPVFAAPTEITQPQVTQNILSQPRGLAQEASSWGITTPEYQHYLWLMQNTPNGHWYQSLDPTEVLALNATTQEDRIKYTKIQAKAMHQRVSRELDFNKLYSKVYSELYPSQKPISSHVKNNLHDTALHPGDRIWLFTGVNTPLGSFVYQHLVKTILSHPQIQFDIYFVGSHLTSDEIQQWAIDNHLPHNKINTQISLNFGNQRFKTITQSKSTTLPLVGVVHQQHFQPITLSSVI